MASSDKTWRVAVVGATGLVGREMISVLEERGFPVSELIPLASTRTAGEKLEWAGKEVTVQIATPAAFKDVDIVLMSAGSGPSKELGPAAAEAGAVVIDNSSYWRMTEDVPLVVPEVNPEDIAGYKARGIIANPNCSTIQMVVALNPLHKVAGLKRIVVSTYQAVSGKGKDAMDEMSSQVTALFNQKEFSTDVFGGKQIAFNSLPHIDVFLDDRFTKEEHKMMEETRKIMHVPNVGICATCVRVPVFNGHAESILAEFEKPIEVDEALSILREAPGMFVMDDPAEERYPTQLDVIGSDATFVGRMRKDPSADNSLTFWCVADNLRKGAASNAVQIAELLVRDHLQ